MNLVLSRRDLVISFNGLGYVIVSLPDRIEISPTFETEPEARHYLDFYFKH
jgi:hypothetical protein